MNESAILEVEENVNEIESKVTEQIEQIEQTEQEEVVHYALWKPIGERDEFVDIDGDRYEFVDYREKDSTGNPFNHIRAWKIDREKMELNHFHVINVSKEELQKLKVWDLLPENVKKEFDSPEIKENISNISKVIEPKLPKETKERKEPKIKKDGTKDGRGRGRKPSEKYLNMPKGIPCSFAGCTFFQHQHPSITEKQAKDKGKTYQEFISTWLCKLHRPKKTRK